MAQKPLVGHYRGFTITLSQPLSLGLFSTSDWPVRETSTCKHTTFTTDSSMLRRDLTPQSQQACGGRATHRWRGHRDRRPDNREWKKRVGTWLLTITDFV